MRNQPKDEEEDKKGRVLQRQRWKRNSTLARELFARQEVEGD